MHAGAIPAAPCEGERATAAVGRVTRGTRAVGVYPAADDGAAAGAADDAADGGQHVCAAADGLHACVPSEPSRTFSSLYTLGYLLLCTVFSSHNGKVPSTNIDQILLLELQPQRSMPSQQNLVTWVSFDMFLLASSTWVWYISNRLQQCIVRMCAGSCDNAAASDGATARGQRDRNVSEPHQVCHAALCGAAGG